MTTRTKLIVGAVVAVVGVASLAPAQGTVIPPNSTTSRVQFTHDGLDTTLYRLCAQPIPTGTVNCKDVGKPAPGLIDVLLQPLPTGTYTLTVLAIGPGGTGTSAPLAFQVVPGAPAAPTGLRIIGG